MGVMLLVIMVLVAVGSLPYWSHSRTWGYGPSGAVGVFVLIEAEDYNYNSGQFQDNPPVSGLDPTGLQVNGFPVGYYGAVGTSGVDYFDTDTSPTAAE